MNLGGGDTNIQSITLYVTEKKKLIHKVKLYPKSSH